MNSNLFINERNNLMLLSAKDKLEDTIKKEFSSYEIKDFKKHTFDTYFPKSSSIQFYTCNVKIDKKNYVFAIDTTSNDIIYSNFYSNEIISQATSLFLEKLNLPKLYQNESCFKIKFNNYISDLQLLPHSIKTFSPQIVRDDVFLNISFIFNDEKEINPTEISFENIFKEYTNVDFSVLNLSDYYDDNTIKTYIKDGISQITNPFLIKDLFFVKYNENIDINYMHFIQKTFNDNIDYAYNDHFFTLNISETEAYMDNKFLTYDEQTFECLLALNTDFTLLKSIKDDMSSSNISYLSKKSNSLKSSTFFYENNFNTLYFNFGKEWATDKKVLNSQTNKLNSISPVSDGSQFLSHEIDYSKILNGKHFNSFIFYENTIKNKGGVSQ